MTDAPVSPTISRFSLLVAFSACCACPELLHAEEAPGDSKTAPAAEKQTENGARKGLNVADPVKGKANVWRPSLADALTEAQRVHKPLLVRFGGASCPFCRVMEQTLSEPELAPACGFRSLRCCGGLMCRRYRHVSLPDYLLFSADDQGIAPLEHQPAHVCQILAHR